MSKTSSRCVPPDPQRDRESSPATPLLGKVRVAAVGSYFTSGWGLTIDNLTGGAMKGFGFCGFWIALLWLATCGTASAALSTGKYKTVVDRLFALQNRYPTVSWIFSIGRNNDGVEMYAIRVSLAPKNIDHKKIGHIV